MKLSTESPSHPSIPVLSPKNWLQRLVNETRTRILLLYAVTLLGVFATAVPVFRHFLFTEVDTRVRLDLREELETFEEAYANWETRASDTGTTLTEFINDYLNSKVPEDDNFHIAFLDGEIYRSNPRSLPSILQADSQLLQELATSQTNLRSSLETNDPEIGRVLYKTHILNVNGNPQGTFIIVHLSAGERSEALISVRVFVKMAIGVIAIAFGLAWLGSHQLLKPVQQLSATAKEINERTLSQRLDVHGSGELAELAQTFNSMMDRVQDAFQSQRSFISDASHELRTPLTIIQGHLEMMDDDPKEQETTIALVMDELERMGRFVNDLLLLTKSERPDFLQLEVINVHVFMEALFAKVSSLSDRPWHLQNLGKGTLIADRLRLTGALLNLANNAAQHTQPNDPIELGVKPVKQGIQFWVRDEGHGIAVADQARIFDRFARAANSRRRSEGAGLGLAIVKAIVEAHGGHVELTSQVGLGSTFSLILPCEPHLEKIDQ